MCNRMSSASIEVQLRLSVRTEAPLITCSKRCADVLKSFGCYLLCSVKTALGIPWRRNESIQAIHSLQQRHEVHHSHHSTCYMYISSTHTFDRLKPATPAVHLLTSTRAGGEQLTLTLPFSQRVHVEVCEQAMSILQLSSKEELSKG